MTIGDLIKYKIGYNSPSGVYAFHEKDNKKCFVISSEFNKVYNYTGWYTSYILDILIRSAHKTVEATNAD